MFPLMDPQVLKNKSSDPQVLSLNLKATKFPNFELHVLMIRSSDPQVSCFESSIVPILRSSDVLRSSKTNATDSAPGFPPVLDPSNPRGFSHMRLCGLSLAILVAILALLFAILTKISQNSSQTLPKTASKTTQTSPKHFKNHQK